MTSFEKARIDTIMNLRCLFLLVLLPVVSTANAQNIPLQRFVASSGDMTNSTYQLSWSIGEVFVNTFSTSNYQAGEGFNESTGLYLITGIEDLNTLGYSLYPNPFSNTITLEAPNEESSNLDISFLDELGKAIQFDIVKEKNRRVITPREIASGIYLFVIRDGNGEIQQFKVIKK